MALTTKDRPPTQNLEGRKIRFVELFAGQREDAIECSLHLTELENAPVYEAISYVWGDPALTSLITLDGKPYPVTINLEAALRHVRQPHTSRLLWVDAICIDLTNNIEKSQQVRLMREIYQKCVQCLAWFGLPPKDKCSAAEVQRFFAVMTKSAKSGRSAAEVGPWFIVMLKIFQQCSWWTRIWTVQEAILPPKCHVLWGEATCSWKDLFAVSRIMVRQWPDVTAETLPIINDFIATMVWTENVRQATDHHFTLYIYASRKASEPRDKIFALLGLVPSGSREVFQDNIDYDIDLTRLNFRTAVELIRASGNLRPFMGITGKPPLTPGCPTWVVEWASLSEHSLCPGFWNHFHAFKRFHAAGNRPMKAIPHEEALSITFDGVKIDTIAWTYRIADITIPSTHHARHQPYEDLWKQVSARVNLHSTYPHTSAPIHNYEAFWRTLLNDSITHRNHDPAARGADVSDAARFASFLIGFCEDPGGFCLCQSLVAYSAMHTFYITTEGYFGIGTLAVQEGDEVWVLFGGNTPYVLRSAQAKGPLHYTLVGESYTHGIMHGEAVKGEVKVEEVLLH